MYRMESAPGARTVINGKTFDYFCGCGYFCLQSNPEMIQAACDAVHKYGIGSATSRSGYGNNPVLIDVEKKAADFFQAHSALYYVSGYMGSTILLQGLIDEYDVIFSDRDSHYSVKDGIAVARKPCVLFEHLDPDDLRRKLREHLKPRQVPLLICDGVFPMTGELSPTPEYCDVLEEYAPFILCVDDAHAVGVIGEKGLGTFEYFGLEKEQLYSCGTLSKAFGGHGGIIAGTEEFIKKLKRNSSIYHASSPPPTPSAAATAKALDIVSRTPSLRKNLWENVARARKGFDGIGIDLDKTPVPILCLHSLREVDLKAIQSELWKKNIAVAYMAPRGYSGVPQGGAIRIAVSNNHTHEQIDRLIAEIAALI